MIFTRQQKIKKSLISQLWSILFPSILVASISLSCKAQCSLSNTLHIYKCTSFSREYENFVFNGTHPNINDLLVRIRPTWKYKTDSMSLNQLNLMQDSSGLGESGCFHQAIIMQIMQGFWECFRSDSRIRNTCRCATDICMIVKARGSDIPIYQQYFCLLISLLLHHYRVE